MPRDPSTGVYSYPPGTPGAPNTPISSTAYNSFLADLVSVLNSAAPINAGGTSGATAIAAWDALATKGTDIASNSSVNLQTADGPSLSITGVASISSVTLNEGKIRYVRAAGAFTLTASASLLVNGSPSGSLTVTAEDLLMFRGGAGGVVSVVRLGSLAGTSFADAADVLTGTDTAKSVNSDALSALWKKGSDTASAGTVALANGGLFHITGTTTITDVDFTIPKDGRAAWVVFDGALTLTHNATTLRLPGGANITTAAGDRALFIQDNADNIICLDYVRAGFHLSALTLVAGDILYANGANQLTKLPKGTALQQLRMNAGATAPEYADPVRALTLIQTLTPGAVANIATSSSFSGYRKLMIEWENVSTTSSGGTAKITLETSVDGATWGTPFDLSTAFANAAQSNSGAAELWGVAEANNETMILSWNNSSPSTGDKAPALGLIDRTSSAAITNLRFAWTVGNFDGGATFRIYGM